MEEYLKAIAEDIDQVILSGTHVLGEEERFTIELYELNMITSRVYVQP